MTRPGNCSNDAGDHGASHHAYCSKASGSVDKLKQYPPEPRAVDPRYPRGREGEDVMVEQRLVLEHPLPRREIPPEIRGLHGLERHRGGEEDEAIDG